MNILHLPLEFNRFFSAKKFPHPLGVGMVDGFDCNGVEHLTVPVMYGNQLWLHRLKDLVGDRKFDQVWLEVVHSIIPEQLLGYITTLAPVRVGFVVESLTIDPNEFVSNPRGTQRRVDNMEQKLPYLTHLVVTDERDLSAFDTPTMLGIASIPEKFIRVPMATADKGVFYGTIYGERERWIRRLKNRLNINPRSPEEDSGIPYMFDKLFAYSNYGLEEFSYFYSSWYGYREAVYSVWINHLHTLSGCAFVNLPHRTNVLSSRVIEGMAAGKPIISPLMYNGVDTLFKEEIMYYEDIDGLIQHIDRLRDDSDLRFYQADCARVNLLENHTTEKRVRQILDFVGRV